MKINVSPGRTARRKPLVGRFLVALAASVAIGLAVGAGAAFFLSGRKPREQPPVNHLILRTTHGNILPLRAGSSSIPDESPPGVPTGLAAGMPTSFSVPLSWSLAGAVANSIEIRRSPAGSGSWTTFATLGGSTTSTTATGLTSDTPYDFAVRAINATGASAWSNPIAATTAEATGPVAPFASIALINTSKLPTPQTNFLPLGHPFKQGDVPAGSRLAATWGDELVPIQVSGRATWPDGSLRFGRVLAKLPAVVGSGSGTLTFRPEPGGFADIPPAGRTAAQIRDDLSANFPYSVAIANLSRGYKPVADGSGSWTWAASDQLTLLGSADSRGRVRCEVIESGPLAITYHCWGPIRSAGNDHPHLVVRAWYRCWLDGTTGTIDRVESLHSLEQGWIEDLAGGSVPADLQVGDVAIKLSGASIPGLSWSGLRIAHHTANALTDIAAGGSTPAEFSGGSHWTTGAPTFHAAFDRPYWNATGLVGPFDLTVEHSAATDPSPAGFSPGATALTGKVVQSDTVNGRSNRAINGTGDKLYHGIHAKWDVAAFYTQERSHVRSCLATALACGTMPLHVRNPSTGRIPNLFKPATYSDAAPGRMGPNRPATFYASNYGGQYSADIKMVARTFGPNGGTDHTGTEAGWPDSWDMSHHPSLVYMSYLRTGAPWLLDRLLVHGNATLMRCYGSGSRSKVLPSGAAPDGVFVLSGQVRSEGWAWKSLYQVLAPCPDAIPERDYLRKVYDVNAAAAAAEVAAAPATAKAQGNWGLITTPRAGYGTYRDYTNSPWMDDFVTAPRAAARLALGDGDPAAANSDAWLDHVAKYIAGRGGLGVGAHPWRVGNYRLLTGMSDGSGDGWLPWDQMPHYTWQNGLVFDAAAQASGWLSGKSQPAHAVNGLPVTPGDRVMFYPTDDGRLPPAELDVGRWYYVAAVDAAAQKIRVSANADLSSPFTSFSPPPSAPTATAVGAHLRLAALPAATGPTMGAYFAGGTSGPNAYAAVYLGTINLLIRLGRIDGDAEWVASFKARFAAMAAASPSWAAGGYEVDGRWAYAPGPDGTTY